MHATFQVTKPGGEVVTFDRTGKRVNPAESAAQYRLAQAVLSGASDRMPVNVAREIVEKTPHAMRSRYMRQNPADESAELYESFHGSPSTEVVEIKHEDHYHGNLAELGVLVELHVETVTGKKVTLGFDADATGEMAENPRKRTEVQSIGGGYQVWKNQHGEWILSGSDFYLGLGHVTKKEAVEKAKEALKRHGKKANPAHLTLSAGVHVKDVFVNDEKIGIVEKLFDGLWRATDLQGRNHGDRYTSAWNAAKQLQLALGRTKNPVEGGGYYVMTWGGGRYTSVGWYGTKAEAEAEVKRLKDRGAWSGRPPKVEAAPKRNPEGYADPVSADTVLLCSNEAGNQLYLIGGDQCLDVEELGFKGPQIKDRMVIGDVVAVVYRTCKDFDNFEETDYIHTLSEDTKEPLPELIYDTLNERLSLAGGCYFITQPLTGTSPGIEN